MPIQTADLCDAFADQVEVFEPIFRDFGGREAFHGPISTVKAFEDNSLVRRALEEPGHGRVLVVDGGASTRCAMLGDRLAALAVENGWVGVVIYGCVRDSSALKNIALGIKALATHPMKSEKRNTGQRDIVVRIAGVCVAPGAYLYADADGIVVSAQRLG